MKYHNTKIKTPEGYYKMNKNYVKHKKALKSGINNRRNK